MASAQPERVYQGASEVQDRARSVMRPIAQRLWRIELADFDRIPGTGPVILSANHISFLDSAFMMLFAGRRISFVGKAEYMDSAKTKYLFPALGMIPIDRSGGEASQAAMDAAEEVLRRGELFGIFPEGTRSRDGCLYKGHTGAARLALKVGCPLLPVGIVGTDKIMPPDSKLPKVGGSCRLSVGHPVDTAKYAGRANDRLVLRQITDELMFEIREMTGQEYKDVYATKKPNEVPTPGKAKVAVVPAAPESEAMYSIAG